MHELLPSPLQIKAELLKYFQQKAHKLVQVPFEILNYKNQDKYSQHQ